MLSIPGGGGFLVFGGLHESPRTPSTPLQLVLLNDLWRFDTETGTWTELCPAGDVPSPRWCHSACMLDSNRMAVFGGWLYPKSEFLSDFYVLDLGENRFDLAAVGPARPSPRCQSNLFKVPGSSYLGLFGGASHKTDRGHSASVSYGDAVVDICDLWLLDLATATWLRCPGEGLLQLRGGVNSTIHVPCKNGVLLA